MYTQAIVISIKVILQMAYHKSVQTVIQIVGQKLVLYAKNIIEAHNFHQNVVPFILHVHEQKIQTHRQKHYIRAIVGIIYYRYYSYNFMVIMSLQLLLAIIILSSPIQMLQLYICRTVKNPQNQCLVIFMVANYKAIPQPYR